MKFKKFSSVDLSSTFQQCVNKELSIHSIRKVFTSHQKFLASPRNSRKDPVIVIISTISLMWNHEAYTYNSYFQTSQTVLIPSEVYSNSTVQ